MTRIGLSVYRANRILCEDGRTRSVQVRSYYDGQGWCFHADTYFTVPAFVRVAGNTIRGFVTSDDGRMYFFAYNDQDHAHLVKPPPSGLMGDDARRAAWAAVDAARLKWDPDERSVVFRFETGERLPPFTRSWAKRLIRKAEDAALVPADEALAQLQQQEAMGMNGGNR